MSETSDYKLIPLGRGRYVKVDPEDYDRLMCHKWHIFREKRSQLYYARAYLTRRKRIFMHQLIINIPKGFQPDHKNRDGLDNRKSNLRIATNSQNAFNSGPRPGSSSRYKGVYLHRRSKKWCAGIKLDRVTQYLGYFDNEIEAALAYDKAAFEARGAFAYLNFPDKVIPKIMEAVL